MADRRRRSLGVDYRVPGRKRPVASSTKATSDFLALVHEEHPAATVSELREIITDETKYIIEPDAVAVLDAHIKAGYGDVVPNWRY